MTAARHAIRETVVMQDPALTAVDRRAAAERIVSVLRGRTGVRRRDASAPTRVHKLPGETTFPPAHAEIAAHLNSALYAEVRDAPMAPLTKAGDTRRRRHSSMAGRRQPPRKLIGRGGRRNGARIAVTEPFAEFSDRFGKPAAVFTSGRANIAFFDGARCSSPALQPDGDTALLARLSRDEVEHGQRLFLQGLDGLGLVQRHNEAAAPGNMLRPRWLIASVENSAAQAYDDRKDLTLVEELMEGEHGRPLRALIARGTDRLVRRELPRAMLYERLRGTNTKLFLCSLGREVEWTRDKLLLQYQGGFDEFERDRIMERFSRGIHWDWVLEGFGWTGPPPFGFYRELVPGVPESKKWLQDHDQFEVLRFGWKLYAEHGGRGGLIAVSEATLEEYECSISAVYWSQLFRNTLYTEGKRPPVKVKGRLIACHDIPLLDPIPPDLFQEVLEILGHNRGPHTVTPVGTFAANGLLVLHEACMGLTHGGRQPQLSVHGPRTAKPALTHTPGPPLPGCHRYAIDHAAFERAVVQAILSVGEPDLLQDAWETADVGSAAPRDSADARAERAQRRARELQRLEAAARDLLRERTREEGAGKAKAGSYYAEQYASYQRRIDQLQEAAASEAELDRQRRHERTRPTPVKQGLRAALRRLLTYRAPTDLRKRRRRAEAIEAAVSSVVVRDNPDGTVTLLVFGTLVGDRDDPVTPVRAAQRTLDLSRAKPRADRASTSINSSVEELTDVDFLSRPDLWLHQQDTPSGSVAIGRGLSRRTDGRPSWMREVVLPRKALRLSPSLPVCPWPDCADASRRIRKGGLVADGAGRRIQVYQCVAPDGSLHTFRDPGRPGQRSGARERSRR